MISDWIKQYFKKSGDTYLAGEKYIHNEHGFMTYHVTDRYFVIMNCYGDGKYWNKLAEEMAIDAGVSKVMFSTRRNPKVFERKYGYKLTGYIMEREV